MNHNIGGKHRKELNKYFEKIYPHIWNQYVLLFNQRTKYLQNFEYMLAFVALIFLIFISVVKDSLNHVIFWLPISSFIISIIILLYQAISRKIWFAWLEKENLKKIFENKEDFYEMAIRDIFEPLNSISSFAKEKAKIYKIAYNMVLFSVFSSLIALSFSYRMILLTLSLIVLTIESFWLINKVEWNYDYNIKTSQKMTKRFFDDWVEGK